MKKTLLLFILLFGWWITPLLCAQTNFLIYSTKSLGEPNSSQVLEAYLKDLKEALQEEGFLLEKKSLYEKEAKAFLKTGIYEGIAEIKCFLIGNNVSLEWKLLLPGEKRQYFNVVGEVGNLEHLISQTIIYLKSIFEKKELIEEIRLIGNMRIKEDLLYPNIATKPGDILDYKKLNTDLRNLYKMGYFENIEIKLEKGIKGVIVIFEFKENPSLKEMVFKGNKQIKTEDLLKIIDFKEGQVLTSKDLDKVIETVKAYYEQLGYSGTEVNLNLEKVSQAQVKLIVEVKEGKKKYIKKIDFVGNKAIAEKELKGFLSVSEKSVFSPIKKATQYLRTLTTPEPLAEPGVYNLAFLYRDLGKIESFYKNRGFIDVKVGEPIIKEEEDGVVIKIPIEEGEQYKVGKVEIKQDLFPEDKIYQKLKTLPGKVFSLENLKQDESILTHLFADYGYAYTKVTTDFDKDPKAKVINISFKVDKGPVVYVNRIEIEGNTKTRDKVIRRQVAIAEGWPYSEKRIEESEVRIRRLGFFEDIKIEKEKAAKEEEVNLKVKVKEMLTGSFGIGGGYSSYDKFMLMLDVTERNFLGKGQRLNVSARLGTKSSRYSINFYDPYFRDTRYSLGWSLYNYEIEYDDFTKDSKGASLKIGYNLTSKLSAYVGYRLDYTQLEDLSSNVAKIILESKDIKFTSAFQFGVSYDSRNRYFMPTKGWYHGLDFEVAEKWLGGDSNYIKIEGEHQVYVPFYKFTFHAALGYGYLTEGGARKIPVYERFFLGGINSVRGYKYGDISPRDPDTDDKIGGTRKLYTQLEFIFPLIKHINLNGVVFYDMGNVWDKNTEFQFSDLRKSVGVGLRWLSPFGPLRLEWGYNIDKKPREDSSNFNFSIGGNF
ncbi:outer membrane protein assembly factor BamA [Thermodesulfobacterium sp. TA1]|uniref:outer membrane protein assembly factor BamA n=1 Tax=Thermodesulfobacterium sp. TA1 TaxID=2234087 RepID=UPI00143DC7DB|nr:outer membrane protein assembly factor BamA [Thermodesulfobacterium sp. TA1]